MPQHQEDEEDWVDEIVVVGERPERGENGGSSGGGSWLADLFGFDNGGFDWGDVGIQQQHPGQLEVSVLGVTGGVPLNDESAPTIGVTIGVDINPSDGSVGIGPATGVSYDPDPSLGFSADGPSLQYQQEVPSPYGGLGYYPIEGGRCWRELLRSAAWVSTGALS